jgi:hypothetical protein
VRYYVTMLSDTVDESVIVEVDADSLDDAANWGRDCDRDNGRGFWEFRCVSEVPPMSMLPHEFDKLVADEERQRRNRRWPEAYATV